MTTATDLEQAWLATPSLTEQPAGAPEQPVEVPTGRLSRRRILQATAGLGGALALNVLGWLPPARLRSARANVGTEHLTCANYDNWSGYNNNTTICVGAPYSRQYCGADGWFLNYHDTFLSSGPVTICGNGIPARNAWRWTFSGTPYRCADGIQQVRGGSAQLFICAWSNP
jgi:hypothetical protein